MPPTGDSDALDEAWALIVPRAELDDGAASVRAAADRREAMLDALTARFAWILAHDVARLPWWMYRLDVRESDVSDAFARSTADALPRALATLLLDRTLAKVASRRRWNATLGGDLDLDARASASPPDAVPRVELAPGDGSGSDDAGG